MALNDSAIYFSEINFSIVQGLFFFFTFLNVNLLLLFKIKLVLSYIILKSKKREFARKKKLLKIIILNKMKFDLKTRVFLVKQFHKLESITLVLRAFRREYPKEAAPKPNTIKNMVSNFEKYGSVGHVAPKPKNPSEKREMAKNQLNFMVSNFDAFSISKAASAIGVSKTLVYHILHDDLHLKP